MITGGGRGSPKYYIIILILVLNYEYFTEIRVVHYKILAVTNIGYLSELK